MAIGGDWLGGGRRLGSGGHWLPLARSSGCQARWRRSALRKPSGRSSSSGRRWGAPLRRYWPPLAQALEAALERRQGAGGDRGEGHVAGVVEHHADRVAQQHPAGRVLGQRPNAVAPHQVELGGRAVARGGRVMVVDHGAGGSTARASRARGRARPGPRPRRRRRRSRRSRRPRSSISERKIAAPAGGSEHLVGLALRWSLTRWPTSRSAAMPSRSSSKPAELSTSRRSAKRIWAATEPTARVRGAGSQHHRQRVRLDRRVVVEHRDPLAPGGLDPLRAARPRSPRCA